MSLISNNLRRLSSVFTSVFRCVPFSTMPPWLTPCQMVKGREGSMITARAWTRTSWVPLKVYVGEKNTRDLICLCVKEDALMKLCGLCSVFTEKYCTEHRIEKLPGPRDWVQILQDQIKLARRRLKRGTVIAYCQVI